MVVRHHQAPGRGCREHDCGTRRFCRLGTAAFWVTVSRSTLFACGEFEAFSPQAAARAIRAPTEVISGRPEI